MENRTSVSEEIGCALESTGSASDPSIPFAFAVDTVIVGGLIIVGVVGNILSVITFTSFNIETTTTVLLTALAVSDTFYLLVHALLFQCLRSIYPATGAFKEYADSWEYINKYEYPLGILFQTLSVLLVTLVAIDRYIAVCWPLRARSWCTVTRARVQVIVALVASAVLNVPRFFTVDVQQVLDPCTNTIKLKKVTTSLSRNIYYTWTATVLYLTLVYFAPVIILFFINIRLVVELHRARRRTVHMTNSFRGGPQTSNGSDRVTAMLCLIVVVFIVCQLPQSIDHLMYTIPVPMVWPEQNFIDITCNFLVALNASLNFFIYVIFGGKFRARLLAILRGENRRKRSESSRSGTTRLSSVISRHSSLSGDLSTVVDYEVTRL